MKLHNNVSMSTRTVSPNLRNQKSAPKNPSFGSTIYTEDKDFFHSDTVDRAKEVDAFKRIAEAIKDNYTDYSHCIENYCYHGESHDHKDIYIDDKMINLTYNDQIKSGIRLEDIPMYMLYSNKSEQVIEVIIDYIKKLDKKTFFSKYDVTSETTVESMQKRYNEGIKAAKEMNVPESDLNEYKEKSNNAITARKNIIAAEQKKLEDARISLEKNSDFINAFIH